MVSEKVEIQSLPSKTKFITKNHRKVPIRIGDTVKTGLGTGRVTFIRHEDDQTPRQFKVEIEKGLGKGSSAKFHDKVLLIKRAKTQ